MRTRWLPGVGVQPGVVALGLDVRDVVDGDEAGDSAELDGYVVGVGFVHGYAGPRSPTSSAARRTASASRSLRTGLST